MFGLSTVKLVGIGLGALALIALVVTILGWRSERNALREWQSGVVTATREASGNPKLHKRDVAQQVRALGQAVTDLKGGIARQNAAVNALAAESDRQRKLAAAAQNLAAQRSTGARATSDRLAASARSAARLAAPCTPSKDLEEAWK